MDGLGEPTSATPLNLGILFSGPISSVPGSASISYLQPLLAGKVFASAGIIIGAELFLFLVQRLFKLEGVPNYCPGVDSEGSILRIPVPELQELLGTLAKYNQASESKQNLPPPNYPSTLPEQTNSLGSFLIHTTPEIPLIVSLVIYGDYSEKPFCPYVVFGVPIFTVPGIRGALPMLILGILGTIFVRSVVPPEATGSKPLKRSLSDTKPFQFNSEELMKLLNRFGKYFGSQ